MLNLAEIGCMYAETFGCMYADFGCMSMEWVVTKHAVVVCMYMEAFGCMYPVVGCKSMERLGACLTVGSFA